MIRLRQKKQQAKAAEAAATPEETPREESDGQPEAEKKGAEEEEGEGGSGMKLLGIGGKSAKKSDKKGAKGRRTPGEIRIQKDIAELDGGDVATVTFPNPNDLTSFSVDVAPDSGYWAGASYNFTFSISPLYPHEPPRVICNTKIYHPNINLEGNVCLNILREDWKPVFDINAVIYGLIHLFVEPNADDPLNHEAADLLRNDARTFSQFVRRSLQGYSVSGESFPKLV